MADNPLGIHWKSSIEERQVRPTDCRTLSRNYSWRETSPLLSLLSFCAAIALPTICHAILEGGADWCATEFLSPTERLSCISFIVALLIAHVPLRGVLLVWKISTGDKEAAAAIMMIWHFPTLLDTTCCCVVNHLSLSSRE